MGTRRIVIIMLFYGFLTATIGCRTSKISNPDELTVTKSVKNLGLEVTLTNNTTKTLRFINPKDFFIEKIESEENTRIPVNPCPCGVPCGNPPVPKVLASGEQLTLNWNYLSRKCKGREAEEYTIETGTYRMGVRYQILEGEIIQSSEVIYIEFNKE